MQDPDTLKYCTLIFLRAPEPGKVKTRLSKVLHEDTVLKLYKNFATGIIKTIEQCSCSIRICYHPSDAQNKIIDWIGHAFYLIPQKGKDLGERMADAFDRAFSDGLEKVILIGTDCPDINIAIIEKAFKSLQKNNVVIGPAFDGGYYLIGFNSVSFFRDIFHNIPWSTENVFQMTIETCNKKNYKIHILPELRDIDTYEDLIAVSKASKKGKNHNV